MWKYAAYVQIFCICDSENGIMYGKICDMRVLAKYAIAYSHITSMLN